MKYGNAPEIVGGCNLEFEEYMHYMYLPVFIKGTTGGLVIPERLGFAKGMVRYLFDRERFGRGDWFSYVYVTARRGFATPGNPLNRPGWHSDGFGTDDINYVWTDRFPTLFAEQEFKGISTDHLESVRQFEEQIDPSNIRTYPDKTLMRLDPSVIHAAPEIPAPGGERSFFKVSFSNSQYNLKGNSHNYLIDYDWKMYDRSEARNDPSRAGQDGVNHES